MDGLINIYIWTSEIGLGPRGGLVAPDQNNNLKGP